MEARDLVGGVLVAGFVVFMIGASAWRLAYEQPLDTALRVIHGDRRRRAWIHVWMLVAMFITPAGVAGVAALVDAPTALVAAIAASLVYAIGAVCWIVSLAFRLAVVPWAAERAVAEGTPPGFAPLDGWAGALYVIHMASAYAASAVLGAALLAAGLTPRWVGWLGIAWGVAFLAGFVATRFSGPFNPPFWAHTYTAVVGVVLLAS